MKQLVRLSRAAVWKMLSTVPARCDLELLSHLEHADRDDDGRDDGDEGDGENP